jgi:lipopolysaccharide/colanic/teichoic acid biosynthesis glycosyltransferase
MFKMVSRRCFLLVFSDIAVLVGAFYMAALLSPDKIVFSQNVPHLLLICFIYVMAFYIFDYYSPFRHFPAIRTLVDTLLITLIVVVVMAVVYYFNPAVWVSRSVFISMGAMVWAGTFFVRRAYNSLLGAGIVAARTMIIGDGPWHIELARLISATSYAGLNVVDVVSPYDFGVRHSHPDAPEFLGAMDKIKAAIDGKKIVCVVLAMEEKSRDIENDIIAKLYEKNIKIISSIHIYEQLTGKMPFLYFRAGHLLGIAEQVTDSHYLIFKRVFDIAGALVLAIVFFPVLLLVMFLLAFEFGSFSRVLFFQERIGRYGNPFTMYKLRTMKDLPDGGKVITRVGRWVRKYRLDEVPQLVNIIKGDMSLIGPRPETPYFVSYCREHIPFYNMVFAVRPGLTGWAQVKFAHTTRVEDYQFKFCYDLYYLKYCSIFIDGVILFESVKVILWGRGK